MKCWKSMATVAILSVGAAVCGRSLWAAEPPMANPSLATSEVGLAANAAPCPPDTTDRGPKTKQKVKVLELLTEDGKPAAPATSFRIAVGGGDAKVLAAGQLQIDGETAFFVGPHGDGKQKVQDFSFGGSPMVGGVQAAPQVSTGMSFRGPLGGLVTGVTITAGPDGKTKVYVNGKEVDASRLERDGKDLQVLDENGQSIFRFRAGSLKLPPLQFSWDASGSTAKRPMIGVDVKPISEALASHLGLEPSSAVLVTSTIEGMPAAEAGVRKNDVIRLIDGKPGVTVESLTAAVRAKKEGECITLGMTRRGNELTIPVCVKIVDAGPDVPILGQLPFDKETGAWVGGLQGVVPWTADEEFPAPEALLKLPQITVPYAVPHVQFWGREAKADDAAAPDAKPDSGTPSATDEQIRRLEERLGRLEQLLQKLLDKKSF